jgi:hypothetical protein
VITGLLLLILLANFVVQWFPRFPIGLAYAGMAAAFAAGFLVPLSSLLFDPPWLAALAATALLCTPVFFAGIVFIRSFAGSRFRGKALGSNIIGALLGGLVESASLWSGLKSLLVLAALAYLLSFLARGRGSQIPAAT